MSDCTEAQTVDVWQVQSDPRKGTPPEWIDPTWWHMEARGDDYGRRWSVPLLVIPTAAGFVCAYVGDTIARDANGRVDRCTAAMFEAVRGNRGGA